MWKISCLIDSTTIAIVESRQNNIPIIAAIAKGIVENDVSASSDYIAKPQNVHFVVPAARSTFSYSIHFVL